MVPRDYNVQNSNVGFCVDKMGVMFMRDRNGKTEAYSASGACGLNTIANLPELREGGGIAYSGERLISFGGWKGDTEGSKHGNIMPRTTSGCQWQICNQLVLYLTMPIR